MAQRVRGSLAVVPYDIVGYQLRFPDGPVRAESDVRARRQGLVGPGADTGADTNLNEPHKPVGSSRIKRDVAPADNATGRVETGRAVVGRAGSEPFNPDVPLRSCGPALREGLLPSVEDVVTPGGGPWRRPLAACGQGPCVRDTAHKVGFQPCSQRERLIRFSPCNSFLRSRPRRHC